MKQFIEENFFFDRWCYRGNRDGKSYRKVFGRPELIDIHLQGKSHSDTIAATIKNPNLYIIDVDNHQQDSIQNLRIVSENVINFFHIDPLLVEKSSTGYHIYYLSKVNLSLWKECFKNLEIGKIKIELYGYLNKFRLPQSSKYKVIQFNTNAKYIEKINTPEPVKFEHIPTFIRQNQKRSISNFIEGYTSGNRVKIIKSKIIPYLVYHPVETYNEFKEFILSKDLGSNDYRIWSSEKIDRDIQYWWKFYQKLKANRSYSPKKFISNLGLLKPEHRKKIQIVVEKIAPYIYLPKKYNKKKYLYYLICELLGYELYNKINPKIVNSVIPISKNLKEELTIGLEIPRPFLIRLSQHYGIPYYHTLKIYNHLIRIKFLSVIPFSKGYLYLKNRFVKCARRIQSVLTSIEKLIREYFQSFFSEENNFICIGFLSPIYIESS